MKSKFRRIFLCLRKDKKNSHVGIEIFHVAIDMLGRSMVGTFGEGGG